MKTKLICIAAAVAAATLCSCTKSGSPAGTGGRMNAWTQPHVLRFSDASDVNTLNPHFGQIIDVGYLSSMTMAYLIKWDEHNRPYAELATQVPTQADGGVSKDGLTITYHLRKGVRWSDGAPFDADDVVFSTRVVLNPATNEVGRQGWDQISKIDEPDKFTVIYHLKKPYSPFIETFFSTAGANPCILPKHLLEKYPNINNVPYNSLPIGIGPFKYLRWDRAQDVILVANPLYWRGRPRLNEVIYKIIPDRDTLLSQLEAKETDMWNLVPGAYLSRVQAVPGLAVIRQPGYGFGHLDFNLQRPVLHDPVVREALRMAIDRRTLRDKIGRGVGILQEVATPPSSPYAVTSIPMVPFDIARANALLDQAGWTRGADGIRQKNGMQLSLTFATSAGSPDTDERIELIRSWWKQIGADITVRHYPPALMFAPLPQGGIVYSNKWDVIIFQWVNDAIGDYSPIYDCKAFPPNGQNDLRWCNPRAQAAMTALYGHYGQVERNNDVLTVQTEFVKDAPSIVTGLAEDIYGYNKDLKNFHPNSVTPFDNMMNVDI
ncbi:MAG TPA: peptide ABC transporter substrate-binding protein [Candidatus Dormibacteraeota bacterium]|nr:peptide ABC transporter substrate-binding protein [Candidatus Dormibacteraeota bacterium]